jgi:hypothetical protein
MNTETKENKQLAPKEKEEDDVDNYIYSCADNVVSSTECTGLIQTPPTNEQEAQAYTDIYAIPEPSQNKDCQKSKSKEKS